jgi:hypothetical protein
MARRQASATAIQPIQWKFSMKIEKQRRASAIETRTGWSGNSRL